MRNLSKTRAVLAAAVVSCGLSAAADAQSSIGVNFVGGGGPNSGSSLAATDVAGLVPQANFNNATGKSGTLMGLLNSGGVNSGAGVVWSSPNTWSSGTDTSTPNGKLLNGYIDSSGSAAGGAMVTVSNIPYAAYDLIVYVNTDKGSGARLGDYEVTTSGPTITQQVAYEKSSSLVLAPPYPSSLVGPKNSAGQNPDPPAGTPAGTFLVFPDLTGSTLTLQTNQATLPNPNFRAPISGFQIYGVPIPEPTGLGVVTVLGGLALTRSRRKAPTA